MKHKLSGILGKRHNTVIGALVDEVMANQSDEVAMRLMPISEEFGFYVEHEIISGYGGLMQERVLGMPGMSIGALSTQNKVISPGSYQEFVPFREKDLLHLRKAGTIGERGVGSKLTPSELTITSRAAQKLMLRIKNLIQKLIWTALFEGTFTYQGKVYVFGIPASNNINATTDWSDYENSNPFGDLTTIVDQDPILRKYKVDKIVMNGTTAANILKSNAVQKWVTNANIKNLDVNAVRGFVAPGLPEFEIVKDSYQEETIVDGKVVLGNAEFFVPDDKLLLVPDFKNQEYPQYGEFSITQNINDPEGDIDNPKASTYVFIDEEGLREKKAPHVDVVGGFNGAPNLKRPADVLTVNV